MPRAARPPAAKGWRGVSLPELLERSIRRGHKRVALQRLLMMEAAGLEASEESRAFCHPLRMTISRREFDRMNDAARDWVRMIGARPTHDR